MKTVTAYLDNSAKSYPDKIAFADENREITFSEVRAEAQKIACELIGENLFKKPVAVYMDKRVE